MSTRTAGSNLRARAVLALTLFAWPSTLAAAQVDSLIFAKVDTSAAERFAEVWRASAGKPSAAQLQAGYLKGGGRGVEVFTEGRIISGEHLAKVVASKPTIYRDAVDRCLPWAKSQDATFRSVNLALRGLLPSHPAPPVAVVVGGDNSGGTVGEGMQVIGLEVICRMSPDRAAFDAMMRQFFAHEAVHTFQTMSGPKADANWLLTQVIGEGTADYVAELVTGIEAEPARAAWARAREAQVWKELAADVATSRAHMKTAGDFDDDGARAVRRWVMNAGTGADGRPGELGYWAGSQIARAYVEASPDPAEALEQLLSFDDPAPIVERAATRLPALKPIAAALAK